MTIALRLKRRVRLLIILAIVLVAGTKLSAQCEPDTANCKDIGNPGEFCPLDLPWAGLDILYDEVVTIIPPGTYEIFSNQLTIFHIRIDSVKNLPPGIDYFPNADIFYPDTAYCIQLTGTPTQIGEFALDIYITATVDFGGPLEAQVVDDTSVVITVVEALGMHPRQDSEFRVYQNIPNPFSELTRIAYFTHVEVQVELDIYNLLGVLVYQESNLAVPGKHNFSFNGSGLQPGTYLYRLKAGENYHTGKIMKSR